MQMIIWKKFVLYQALTWPMNTFFHRRSHDIILDENNNYSINTHVKWKSA